MNTEKDPATILLQYFEKFSLTEEHVNMISSFLKPLSIKKGEKFCEKGKRTQQLGVLVNGLLIAWYETKGSDKEIVSRFYYTPRNIIVTSFESYYAGTPANETIEAVEDSHMLCITRDELYKLYEDVPEMNTIGRELAEQSYIQALQRIHDLQALTVEERIKAFKENHSELYNRVQRQHLCSYLGTNRNSLARYFGNQKT